jgi:membrane protease YdiL (CAAX protease family)
MFVVKQLVVVAAAMVAGNLAVGVVKGSWALSLVVGVLAAALVFGAYGWAVRRMEHRAPVEISPAGAGRALARGLAIGLLMFATVIAIIASLGGYRVAGGGSVPVAVTLLGSLTAAAAAEELLFRGLVFRRLEARTGTGVALAVSAALFGAIHMVNPEATLWGAIAIAVEAGLMLGAVYVATRTLWLPIGLHLGWNFAAAGIFGTEVSGAGMPQGLLRGVTSGPTALSGGAFGPEASVVTVVAGVALTVIFLRLAHRRGHLVPIGGRRGPNAVVKPATVTL